MVYFGVFLCCQGNMQIASAAIKKINKKMARKWTHNEAENKRRMFTESQGLNDSVSRNWFIEHRLCVIYLQLFIRQIWGSHEQRQSDLSLLIFQLFRTRHWTGSQIRAETWTYMLYVYAYKFWHPLYTNMSFSIRYLGKYSLAVIWQVNRCRDTWLTAWLQLPSWVCAV